MRGSRKWKREVPKRVWLSRVYLQVESQALTFADGAVAGVAWLTGAAVPPHGVETEGILVTAMHAALTLIMFWGRKPQKDTLGPQTNSSSTPSASSEVSLTSAAGGGIRTVITT